MLEKQVATSFSCRDINCEELRSRRHSVVATTDNRKEGRDFSQLSRHQTQVKKVATSFSCRDISSTKDKLRPDKSLCDITETTDVATKNRGRDNINKMGQLT